MTEPIDAAEPRATSTWNADDEASLEAACSSGIPMEDLAAAMNRSVASVKAKTWQMGLSISDWRERQSTKAHNGLVDRALMTRTQLERAWMQGRSA